MKLFSKIKMLKKGGEIAASGGVGAALALVASSLWADGDSAFNDPQVQAAIGSVMAIVFSAGWRMVSNWLKNRD